MGTFANQFEQKLETQLKAAEKLRDSFAEKLSSKSSLTDTYNNVIAKLREINMQDPRKGEANPKEYIKLASSASLDARQAIAFKGPSEGVAKTILKYLPSLGLDRENSLASALLCVLEDCERSFSSLPDAKLPLEDQLLVILAALKHQPVLNFEEYKTQEVMYQTANTDDEREMQEIQRRYDQVRGRKTQFVRKHLLNYLPEEIKAQPNYRKVLLQVSLQRDAFGTLETLRESASQEALKSTSTNLLDGLAVEEKLDLLKVVTKLGMGLASNYLDLFTIPNDVEWHPTLQEILRKDATAGNSLFGVYAFEGVHHYPFDLGRLELILPRRITNSEAADFLKRSEAASEEPKKARTHSASAIAEAVTTLQEKEVGRFLESFKWGIARNWKAYVNERKREIVFGDSKLKVRDIIFLVAYSLFDSEEKIESIFEMVQKNHPQHSEDVARIYLLANRYYFFDLLGINVSFLFNRAKKSNGSFGTLIEDLGEYQIHSLLHACMSIHIKIGDTVFKDMSIAWPMLIGQCEGKIDTVFNELIQLFDTFDLLLTIVESAIPDLSAWTYTLIDALSQDAPDLPTKSTEDTKQTNFRITTRTMIARSRDLLYHYCLDALYLTAKSEGITPVNVIQALKIPRSKTDKLRILLSNDPNKAKR